MSDANLKAAVSTGTGRVKYQDVTVETESGVLADLNGTHVDNATDDGLVPAIPVVFMLSIADQASGSVDYTPLPFGIRVIDAWCVKIASDGHATEDTITISDGSNAITDAMAIGSPDDTGVTRAGNINDANHEIAEGGILGVEVAKGGSGGNNTACIVYVQALRV